jgi:hypothetical protein
MLYASTLIVIKLLVYEHGVSQKVNSKRSAPVVERHSSSACTQTFLFVLDLTELKCGN